ncbi:hypothetical protein D3C86_1658240 [compost metagenome]
MLLVIYASPEGATSRIGLGEVDLVTFDVAGHEGQAWHTEAGHVQVITYLDRPFVRTVEFGVLHRVGQPDRVDTDEVEGLVAIDLHVGQGQLVRAEGVGTFGRPTGGVQLAGTSLTLVAGLVGGQGEVQ